MEHIKIVTLMEDNLCEEGMIAEHGLSIYIETEKHKILVDTGQSEKTWVNAKNRGIDLTKVDLVFLSHGHYDHSGGLMSFATINPRAKIYLRENAGGEYYSLRTDGETYIGIDSDIMKLPGIHLVSCDQKIDEELSLFTNVKSVRLWPKGNKRLLEKKNEVFVQDVFSHEQYLVIKNSEDEYALISGCAHNGILNILDAFRQIYHTDPSLVLSGFHMIQKEYSESDLNDIRKTAEELKQMDTVFYTGHCTGETAFEILKTELGDHLKPLWEL